MEAGEPGGVKPRVAALRNTWVTADDEETAVAIDWFRASYIIYAGLGWGVAAGDQHAEMDFSGDIETALAGVVETVIAGPPEVVEAGMRATADRGRRRCGAPHRHRRSDPGDHPSDDATVRPPGHPEAAGSGRIVGAGGTRRQERGGPMRLGLVAPLGREIDWAVAAERHGLFGVEIGGERGVECCTAAAVAMSTSAIRLIVRLRIGFDHPVTLAEELAVLDNLSNGRVVVLADVTGLDTPAPREDVDLVRRALSSRPIRHRGARWQIPANLPEHDAPDAVMVTPPPAQVEVPWWITGLPVSEGWDTRISRVAERHDELEPAHIVTPATDRLSGELDADRSLVTDWADAGASHLLLHPSEGWEPNDLGTASRYLAPLVAMVAFPNVIVTAPPPRAWPHPVPPPR